MLINRSVSAGHKRQKIGTGQDSSIQSGGPEKAISAMEMRGEERCSSGHSCCPQTKMKSLTEQRVQPCEKTVRPSQPSAGEHRWDAISSARIASCGHVLRNGPDIRYCGSRHDKMDIYPQHVELLYAIQHIFPWNVGPSALLDTSECQPDFKNAQRQYRHKPDTNAATVNFIRPDFIISSEQTNKVQLQITRSACKSSITAGSCMCCLQPGCCFIF